MQKAFLFDMDGVLADTENEWTNRGYEQVLRNYFGPDLHKQVLLNSGMSIKDIFDAYTQVGFTGPYADFYAQNVIFGKNISLQIPLTEGVEDFIDYLESQGYLLGIVSNSASEWVDALTARLRSHDKFKIILSLNNHPTLKAKPQPDGYAYAMETLGVLPENTFILEDSRTGIQAAKASGAVVIGFTGYPNPVSTPPLGADTYAVNMKEVQAIVDKYARP